MDLEYYDEYFAVNGIKEYIIMYPNPESDVILLNLHGGPGSAYSVYSYNYMPEYLPATIVYYDQRGAGKTQAASKTAIEDITFDNLVDDLKKTIDYLADKFNTHKIVLVGHSFGTVLATEYLRKYPDTVFANISEGKVISIIKGEKINFDELKSFVLSGGLDSDKKIIEELDKVNYPLIEDKDSFYAGVIKLRKVSWVYRPSYRTKISPFKLLMHSPNTRLKDLKWIKRPDIAQTNNKNLYLKLYDIDYTTDTKSPIQQYFIQGKDDFICPTVLVEEYFNKLVCPKKAFYSIPYSAHAPHKENPVEYWNVIGAILFNIFNEPLNNTK